MVNAPSRFRLLQIVSVWLASTLFISVSAMGAERAAPELLPPTTVVFVELNQPEELLRTIREHPLRQRVESLDQVRAAREKKEYLDAMAAVAIFESRLGLPWYKIISQSTGNGLVVAVDAPTNGIAVLAQAVDDLILPRLIETLAVLARQDASGKGMPDPIKSAEYRGIKAFALGDAKFAAFGRWLVVTNQDTLGKQVIDRWLDSPPASLASNDLFLRARAQRTKDTAWGYVNLSALRQAGVAKELFSGRADNPIAEMLLGGLLSTLRHADFASGSVEFDTRRLGLTVSFPFDRSWAGEPREHFFGPQGLGAAPPLSLHGDTLLVLSAYRDISRMWLRAGDLFNEQTNEGLAKADSSLTTLFGGKDFGEDILGSFQPGIQIVASRQVFTAGQPAPAIKLPTFALHATLKDPVRMQPELRRIFQSLIGFLNVVGAMNGQPPLDQDMEKTAKGQIIIAKYLPDANAKDQSALKIQYNFSPTIAFEGERCVIASSDTLARQLLLSRDAAPAVDVPDRVTNTNAAVRFNVLREILTDNQAQLVAQDMLKEGHNKAEAEKAIRALLDLVGWLDRASLKLDSSARDLRISLGIELKQDGGE